MSGRTVMHIHSHYLRCALAAVATYYPGFESILHSGKIEPPYRVLVHLWKDLEAYRDNQPACHDEDWRATTARHIDVLLGFLREQYADALELERKSRWENPSGEPTATWDMFWVLLAPGTVVYVNNERDARMLMPGVVHEVKYRESWTGHGGLYEVWVWNVRWKMGRLRRSCVPVHVEAWNGERPIRSLPVIPERFVPGGPEDVRRKMVRLGEMFWELAKQPTYKEYDGPVWWRRGRATRVSSSPRNIYIPKLFFKVF